MSTKTKKDVPLIDEEILSNLQNLMGDKFKVMLDQYIEISHQQIQDTEKATFNNDFKTISMCMHTLKSSSSSIGMATVSKQASDIEEFAEKHDMSEIIKRVAILKESFSISEENYTERAFSKKP